MKDKRQLEGSNPINKIVDLTLLHLASPLLLEVNSIIKMRVALVLSLKPLLKKRLVQITQGIRHPTAVHSESRSIDVFS